MIAILKAVVATTLLLLTLMGSDGVLLRSSDPAYLWALEQHSAEIDRMLGRAPISP